MRRRPLMFTLLACCSALAFLASSCGQHRQAKLTSPTSARDVNPGALGQDPTGKGTPAPGATVLVCHEDENGEHHVIRINVHAWPAHEQHGDVVLVDADGDGYVAAQNECVPGGDCDDTDPSINPGAQELCDGKDNDCNGRIDEGMEALGTQVADILRDLTRRNESAMGDLVADAMREQYPDAEAAFTNSGGLRADLLYSPPVSGEAPGEILCRELFAVLPFGNKNVVLTVTGAQLEQMFLNGLSPRCSPAVPTGRFPQVSGLKVVYSCNGGSPVVVGMWKLPQGLGGPQVPIGPNDTIRLVTNDFMYSGGDGYSVLAQATNVVVTNDTMLQALSEYVMAHSPIAPPALGRIVFQP